MNGFLDWVGTTTLSQTLQNQFWMVPTIQAVHIMAITAVFTSALVLDMRLLGVMHKGQALQRLNTRFMPWIGWGVLVLLVTGVLLMIAEPTRAILNPYFQIKMAALVVVGAITWSLAKAVARSPDAWAEPERNPVAKPLAVASLILWAIIVTAGRWIAYGP